MPVCASSSTLVEKGVELEGGRQCTLLGLVRVSDDRSRIHLELDTPALGRPRLCQVGRDWAKSTVAVLGWLKAWFVTHYQPYQNGLNEITTMKWNGGED
ncbi:hypothetical protein BHM03_00030919 [Ensete ventricosum]|nr:hypothetical protein BHM03_00030919 [Ensete ventricosum]